MANVERGYSLGAHHEGESRQLDAPILRLDLARELEDLRGTRGWRRGHASKTLVKHPDLRVVLIALKAGASLGEHHTASRISIQVLEGRARLQLPDEVVELSARALLTLAPSVPHDLEAIEPSVLLLTIAGPAAEKGREWS